MGFRQFHHTLHVLPTVQTCCLYLFPLIALYAQSIRVFLYRGHGEMLLTALFQTAWGNWSTAITRSASRRVCSLTQTRPVSSASVQAVCAPRAPSWMVPSVFPPRSAINAPTTTSLTRWAQWAKGSVGWRKGSLCISLLNHVTSAPSPSPIL